MLRSVTSLETIACRSVFLFTDWTAAARRVTLLRNLQSFGCEIRAEGNSVSISS
jgi:hypothetical protein